MINQIIDTPWNFMRWLRLGMGSYLVIISIANHELVAGFLGGLFLLQALFNVGCCGPQGCSTPQSKNPTGEESTDDITYQEIKKEK